MNPIRLLRKKKNIPKKSDLASQLKAKDNEEVADLLNKFFHLSYYSGKEEAMVDQERSDKTLKLIMLVLALQGIQLFMLFNKFYG